MKTGDPICNLQEKLQAYCASGIYPMHMPGHKRKLAPVRGLPYEWDVTEVEGTDDLHDADGILKEAMDRTGELVGSKRTWYLVGGSTCGNLAAVYAMVPRGGEVIAARNCHKSVYHAAELLELTVHWIHPAKIPEFDIPGSVDPAKVERLLKEFPDSAAVILTSPTYEGILSDVKEIARITHEAGKLLLVDEAHGAHLGLFRPHALTEEQQQEKKQGKGQLEKEQKGEEYFPDSAVHLGADVVVQSAHKTLPSLTQTAYLHRCSERVSEQALEQGLNIFETSSPSYPLMASLDGCTGWLLERGEESFRRWRERLHKLEQTACKWENLSLLGASSAAASKTAFWGKTDPYDGFIYDRDPGKLLIRSRAGSCSGKGLQELLRRREGIEAEMSCGGNVLLMTSCADTDEDFERLRLALEHLNQEMGRTCSKAGILSDGRNEPEFFLHVLPGRQELCLARAAQLAMHGETVRMHPDSAVGRICAEYVTPYPPGAPLLIPGERITGKHVRQLQEMLRTGAQMKCSLQ